MRVLCATEGGCNGEAVGEKREADSTGAVGSAAGFIAAEDPSSLGEMSDWCRNA